MSVKSKAETIEQYLARGGSIKKLPMVEYIKQSEVIKKAPISGTVTIMSYEDADLFYGEVRKNAKPKKAKPSLKIDLNALPEALRSKFINKLKEESDGENYEENQIEEDNEEDSE